MRTLVLRGLPIMLGDDASNFYNACFVNSQLYFNGLCHGVKNHTTRRAQIKALEGVFIDISEACAAVGPWVRVKVAAGPQLLSGEIERESVSPQVHGDRSQY
ncbi:hypothetical protein M9458_052441 [Cirrhinus mrigala]|uniref:Uncharacterized protein n=1 Tax=Cirrhinus mrigala TaxID=683832 RepID=A0ABD0MXA6_CIRMR